ncbi:hypothetical protein FOIG_00837 [Fusarium odoratissimum NRRL 54006]|nr:uncharacterized protein FOIG_00837 [Fusarium odoratissimum NRRL 54006]EXM10963.1 hypothetical protein FOIG_00837 [Fusarium odoratissimum NRRL 54006]
MSQSESLYLPLSPPSSVKMDSNTTDGTCDNPSSPPTRSTVGSQVSVSGEFVLGSNISVSPQTHTLEISPQPPVPSPNHYSSTPYLNTPTPESTYLSTPASQSYSQFPTLASVGIDSTWSQPDQAQEGTRSLISFPQEDRHQLAPNSRQAGRSTSMSTVAIQFDPAFTMGPRSAFTWPGPLESSNSGSSLLSPGLPSMGHVSGSSLTPPPQSRSVTSSPPRLSLSADQREVKRQSDRARRDSRLVNRMRRANSNSYVDSSPSALGLAATTTAMNISAYTAAPAPVTLMSDTPTTMSSSTYLQSYSPSLEDHQPQSAPVYPTSYPQSL